MYNSIIQIGSHVGNTINDPIFANITKDTKLILVEPVPYLFNTLKQNYHQRFPGNNFIFINKAVSDTVGHKYLNVPSEDNDYAKLPFWASQLSSFNDEHIIKELPNSNIKIEKILVETTTLNQIIDDYNVTELDFLHTDTEGHDYYILMSFNFKVKPKFIQFEHKHMDAPLTVGEKYLELTEFLIKNGYEFVSQDTEDTVFKYKETYQSTIDKSIINTLIKSLSIIIPVYNCEKYIGRTIESIITSLDYFHDHYPLADQVKSEIIVVNDCSTDNTTFFVSQFIGKKYPVKLVNHSINQGAGPARNTGFKNSQGEILFFCDGDDLFLPAHIYVCFMLLQGQYDAKTTFALVQDNYQAQVNFLEQPVDAIKTKVKIQENIHPAWQQGIENSLPLNLCVRRSCHEFLEGFPEDPVYKKIGGAEDSAYYRYLCEFFKIAHVNLATVQYIRYPGNSIDKQMPKFQLPPGQYQGTLPDEKTDLLAEARLMEKAKIDILKEKYQRVYKMQNVFSLSHKQTMDVPSQPKTIIITASDAKYFELVQGNILSIREKQPGKTITIGFFNLGCNEEQLAWLKTQVNIIIKPDWDFDFPTRNEVPEYLKGLLTRPFLRRYFPDFEVYVWIDADAWVQNWQAVELLILGAMKRGLAVIPELDRSYNLAYGKLPWYWQFVYRDYQSVFDEETAKKLYSYPVINAGVFALHRDAPHWQMWEKLLRQALQKNAGLMTDQVVLNFLVYNTELSKQTEMLPAWCNWSCNFGLPIWDVEKLCFVEPSLPHTPIGIIHLTAKKHDVVTLSTTINTLTNQSLRYPIKNSNHQVMTNLTNIEIINKKNKRDYVSPGLQDIKLDPAFPNMIIGNTDQQPWQYLRREIPHNWYVDDRHPFVGFLSRDEAHILYNTALKFTGKRALEIGCWMGWSACHLIAAGVNLDIVDPMLEKPEFQQSVINSLQATTRITGISTEVSINAGYSPQAVLNLATQHKRKWSLIFIDGNHDAPGPLNDAIACEPLAEDTAMVLFHDLAAPDVAQGLDYFQQKGWKTMIYQTMQIMGVAWRGNIQPVEHQPDPQVNWVLPKHLAHHPVSGFSQNNLTLEEIEFNEILDLARPYTLLSIERLKSLYHLTKQICLNDLPGNIVECGSYKGGAIAFMAKIVQKYSKRPRYLYAFDTFTGMPEPREVDQHNNIPANDTGFGVGTLKAPIKENLGKICQILQVQDIVTPIPGLFAETLPQHKLEIGDIALLHADGDWYESTMDIFDNLYDQVINYGFIQVDDYGYWTGCKKALHDFEQKRSLSFVLNQIDYTGVWFQKNDKLK